MESVMEIFNSMNATGWMVVAAAGIIIVLVLFSRVIKAMLKTAVVLVMLMFIVYFLHQAGIIQIPGIGN
jgi:hypothetical protein